MKLFFIFSFFILTGSVYLNAKESISTLFPLIDIESSHASLVVIASYGKEYNWNALSKNSVRLVVQPAGIVSVAYEVDFHTGAVRVCPGAHSEESVSTFILSSEEKEQLLLLLTSNELLSLPSRNQKIGRGGTSYFIETNTEGDYRWILHWAPDDIIIKRIFDFMREIKLKYNQK